jgi:tetratricopeptide (TPR) repeat protein/tRNA A-37 threonylcarbamoyl transferase component Bud32
VSDLYDSPAPGQGPDPFDSQAETLFDGPPGSPVCPDRERPDEEPPERIGHYRIEKPLGHGGMGEVFLAWDEILERRVAIKRIRRGPAQSGDQRERFHREAKAAGRLSHSSIVQIHELILDQDAIVMEYVHGSTLAERLETGPLPVRESLRLAREVAEGLATAHAAHLIHRDLKAENVIITPQGQAKILDFGLVKPITVGSEGEAEALTRKGVLLGTYQSMSPEQASGGQVDERSDLFSLGVLLYEMLSGIAPFRGDNPLDTLKRVIADTPPPLTSLRADIPPAVNRLVERLLAKPRDERPGSAQEVIQELRGLEARLDRSGTHMVSEMATADWTPEVKRKSRWRWWYAAAAGAAIVLAAMCVVAVRAFHRAALSPPAKHDLRPMSDETLSAFQQIQRRVNNGEAVNLGAELKHLEGITDSAPRFAEARILAARLALRLYQSTREAAYRKTALQMVAEAESIAPNDPDLLAVKFQVALDTDPPQAKRVLRTMERVLPANDHRTLIARSFWLERQRDWQGALTNLNAAALADRSWQTRMMLAQMEARHGKVDDARRLLRELLTESPDNPWVQEAFGDAELTYGDAVEVERWFERIARSSPRRNPLVNLGMARFLQGNYSGAVEAYQKALAAEPYHASTLLNLADAEVELGDFNKAFEGYQRALERIEEIEKSGRLTTTDEMIKAQCLARIRKGDAAKIAGEALRRSSGSPMVELQAAMVYSLVDDRDSALKHAKAARAAGIQKRWFQGSAFQALAGDPAFQDVIR